MARLCWMGKKENGKEREQVTTNKDLNPNRLALGPSKYSSVAKCITYIPCSLEPVLLFSLIMVSDDMGHSQTNVFPVALALLSLLVQLHPPELSGRSFSLLPIGHSVVDGGKVPGEVMEAPVIPEDMVTQPCGDIDGGIPEQATISTTVLIPLFSHHNPQIINQEPHVTTTSPSSCNNWGGSCPLPYPN